MKFNEKCPNTVQFRKKLWQILQNITIEDITIVVNFNPEQTYIIQDIANLKQQIANQWEKFRKVRTKMGTHAPELWTATKDLLFFHLQYHHQINAQDNEACLQHIYQILDELLIGQYWQVSKDYQLLILLTLSLELKDLTQQGSVQKIIKFANENMEKLEYIHRQHNKQCYIFLSFIFGVFGLIKKEQQEYQDAETFLSKSTTLFQSGINHIEAQINKIVQDDQNNKKSKIKNPQILSNIISKLEKKSLQFKLSGIYFEFKKVKVYQKQKEYIKCFSSMKSIKKNLLFYQQHKVFTENQHNKFQKKLSKLKQKLNELFKDQLINIQEDQIEEINQAQIQENQNNNILSQFQEFDHHNLQKQIAMTKKESQQNMIDYAEKVFQSNMVSEEAKKQISDQLFQNFFNLPENFEIKDQNTTKNFINEDQIFNTQLDTPQNKDNQQNNSLFQAQNQIQNKSNINNFRQQIGQKQLIKKRNFSGHILMTEQQKSQNQSQQQQSYNKGLPTYSKNGLKSKDDFNLQKHKTTFIVKPQIKSQRNLIKSQSSKINKIPSIQTLLTQLDFIEQDDEVVQESKNIYYNVQTRPSTAQNHKKSLSMQNSQEFQKSPNSQHRKLSKITKNTLQQTLSQKNLFNNKNNNIQNNNNNGVQDKNNFNFAITQQHFPNAFQQQNSNVFQKSQNNEKLNNIFFQTNKSKITSVNNDSQYYNSQQNNIKNNNIEKNNSVLQIQNIQKNLLNYNYPTNDLKLQNMQIIKNNNKQLINDQQREIYYGKTQKNYKNITQNIKKIKKIDKPNEHENQIQINKKIIQKKEYEIDLNNIDNTNQNKYQKQQQFLENQLIQRPNINIKNSFQNQQNKQIIHGKQKSLQLFSNQTSQQTLKNSNINSKIHSRQLSQHSNNTQNNNNNQTSESQNEVNKFLKSKPKIYKFLKDFDKKKQQDQIIEEAKKYTNTDILVYEKGQITIQQLSTRQNTTQAFSTRQDILENLNLLSEKNSTMHYVRAEVLDSTNKNLMILDDQIMDLFNLKDLNLNEVDDQQNEQQKQDFKQNNDNQNSPKNAKNINIPIQKIDEESQNQGNKINNLNLQNINNSPKNNHQDNSQTIYVELDSESTPKEKSFTNEKPFIPIIAQIKEDSVIKEEEAKVMLKQSPSSRSNNSYNSPSQNPTSIFSQGSNKNKLLKKLQQRKNIYGKGIDEVKAIENMEQFSDHFQFTQRFSKENKNAFFIQNFWYLSQIKIDDKHILFQHDQQYTVTLQSQVEDYTDSIKPLLHTRIYQTIQKKKNYGYANQKRNPINKGKNVNIFSTLATFGRIKNLLNQLRFHKQSKGYINKKTPVIRFQQNFEGYPTTFRLKSLTIEHEEQKSYFIQINRKQFNIYDEILIPIDVKEIILDDKFETVWPIYLQGFENFLKNQNVELQYLEESQQYQLSQRERQIQIEQYLEGPKEVIELYKNNQYDQKSSDQIQELIQVFIKYFVSFGYEGGRYTGRRLRVEVNVNSTNILRLQMQKLVRAQQLYTHEISKHIDLININYIDQFYTHLDKLNFNKQQTFNLSRFQPKKFHTFLQQATKENYIDHFSASNLKQKIKQLSLKLDSVYKRIIQKFYEENPIICVFVKKSIGELYYLVICKFKPIDQNKFNIIFQAVNMYNLSNLRSLELEYSEFIEYLGEKTRIQLYLSKIYLTLKFPQEFQKIIMDFVKNYLRCQSYTEKDSNQIYQKLFFLDILKKGLKHQKRQKYTKQKTILMEKGEMDKEDQDMPQIFSNNDINYDDNKINKKEKMFNYQFLGIYNYYYKNKKEIHTQDDKEYLEKEDQDWIQMYKPKNENIQYQLPQYKENENPRDLVVIFKSIFHAYNLMKYQWFIIKQSQIGNIIQVKIKPNLKRFTFDIYIRDFYRNKFYYQKMPKNQSNFLIGSMLLLQKEREFGKLDKQQIHKLICKIIPNVITKNSQQLQKQHAVKIKQKPGEEMQDIRPLLVSNTESLRNNLLLNRKELLQYYIQQQRFTVINLDQIGKSIVQIQAYIIKHRQFNYQQPFLFKFDLSVYNKRTTGFKFLISSFDFKTMDHQLYDATLNQQFTNQTILSIQKTVMTKLTFIKGILGKFPVIQYQIGDYQKYQQQKDLKKQSRLPSDNPFKIQEVIYEEDDTNSNLTSNSESIDEGMMTENEFFSHWKNDIQSLKYYKNKFRNNEYDQKESKKEKSFLEEHLYQRRIILTVSKRIGNEFTVFTIKKDMIMQQWTLQIYIPISCRTLTTQINIEELKQCNYSFIIRNLPEKLLFFSEYQHMVIFSSYYQFCKRINLNEQRNKYFDQNDKNKSAIKGRRNNIGTQQQENTNHNLITKTPIKILSMKRNFHKISNLLPDLKDKSSKAPKKTKFDIEYDRKLNRRQSSIFEGFGKQIQKGMELSPPIINLNQGILYSQNYNNLKGKKKLAYLIKKYFIQLAYLQNPAFLFLDIVKYRDIKKQDCLNRFAKLSKFLDDTIKGKQKLTRATNLINFVEAKIWEGLLSDATFKPCDNFQNLTISINNKKLILKEVLFTDYVKFDKNYQYSTEISIDFIGQINKPSSLGIKIDEKEDKKKLSILKRFQKFYFYSIETISYSNTSKFSFNIQNLSIQNGQLQKDQINVREIVNLYIADGFYKFQSNYMNSKLSYSELKTLCYFIVHKMKNSGFLNQNGKYENDHTIATQQSESQSVTKQIQRRSSIGLNLQSRKSKIEQIKSDTQSLKLSGSNLNENITTFNPLQNLQNKNNSIVLILDLKQRIYVKGEFFQNDQSFKFIIRRFGNDSSSVIFKSLKKFTGEIYFLKEILKMGDIQKLLKLCINHIKYKLIDTFISQEQNDTEQSSSNSSSELSSHEQRQENLFQLNLDNLKKSQIHLNSDSKSPSPQTNRNMKKSQTSLLQPFENLQVKKKYSILNTNNLLQSIPKETSQNSYQNSQKTHFDNSMQKTQQSQIQNNSNDSDDRGIRDIPMTKDQEIALGIVRDINTQNLKEKNEKQQSEDSFQKEYLEQLGLNQSGNTNQEQSPQNQVVHFLNFSRKKPNINISKDPDQQQEEDEEEEEKDSIMEDSQESKDIMGDNNLEISREYNLTSNNLLPISKPSIKPIRPQSRASRMLNSKRGDTDDDDYNKAQIEIQKMKQKQNQINEMFQNLRPELLEGMQKFNKIQQKEDNNSDFYDEDSSLYQTSEDEDSVSSSKIQMEKSKMMQSKMMQSKMMKSKMGQSKYSQSFITPFQKQQSSFSNLQNMEQKFVPSINNLLTQQSDLSQSNTSNFQEQQVQQTNQSSNTLQSDILQSDIYNSSEMQNQINIKQNNNNNKQTKLSLYVSQQQQMHLSQSNINFKKGISSKKILQMHRKNIQKPNTTESEDEKKLSIELALKNTQKQQQNNKKNNGEIIITKY